MGGWYIHEDTHEMAGSSNMAERMTAWVVVLRVLLSNQANGVGATKHYVRKPNSSKCTHR